MSAAHRILSPDEPDPAAVGRVALAIMTKAPRPGAVKTRLTPPLAPAEAAELNVCFLRDTASAILSVASRAQGIACFTPADASAAYSGILPTQFQLIPQRVGDFGQRLFSAAQDLFNVGFAAVCLIDSDSPTVPGAAFAEAVDVLLQPNEKLVLGPSEDGGYYLMGLRRLHAEVFRDIDWSTERVLAQTLARAEELHLPVHLLPAGFDVDDRESLRRLCDQLLGAEESSAPATQQFLRHFVAREGRERIWPNELVLP